MRSSPPISKGFGSRSERNTRYTLIHLINHTIDLIYMNIPSSLLALAGSGQIRFLKMRRWKCQEKAKREKGLAERFDLEVDHILPSVSCNVWQFKLVPHSTLTGDGRRRSCSKTLFLHQIKNTVESSKFSQMQSINERLHPSVPHVYFLVFLLTINIRHRGEGVCRHSMVSASNPETWCKWM